MSIILEIQKENKSCYMAKIEVGAYELRQHTNSNEITQYFINEHTLTMIRQCENINEDISFHIVHPSKITFHSLDEFASYVNKAS